MIDFRVKPPKGFQVDTFLPLTKSLQANYPTTEKQQVFQLQQKQGQPWPPTPVDMGVQGYRVRSQDKLTVVQFRMNGFTFSRLRPYTSWEEILPQAMELWAMYLKTANPESVTRLAVRYINHLRLPPVPDLRQYLESPPTIPPNIPRVLSGFLNRILVQEPETRIAARIDQASEKSVDPNLIAIMLDIDVYKRDAIAPNDSRIGECLNDLRAMKNRIFFNCITEETANLFE